MPSQNIHLQRIALIAGLILLGATLIIGIAVFIIMQYHTKTILDASLQSSLQNRVQLIEYEIDSTLARTRMVASRSRLSEELQHWNAKSNNTVAREAIDRIIHSFQSEFNAVAVFDKTGREVAHSGSFVHAPTLIAPLHLPGRVRVLWDGQLLLYVGTDLRKNGSVIGEVVTETPLPVTYALNTRKSGGEADIMTLCAPIGADIWCFPNSAGQHSPAQPRRVTHTDISPISLAIAGKTGVITARNAHHRQIITAYTPVGELGLGMTIERNDADLFELVWNELRYLIPLLLLVFGGALLLLHRLLAPLVKRLVHSEAKAAQRADALTSEIAEHRRAQAQLLRFQNVLDNTLDMIFMFEPDSLRFIYLNQGAILGTGYSREDLLNMAPHQISPLLDEAEFHQLIAPLLGGERTSLRFETTYRRCDGTDMPVDIFLQTVKNSPDNAVFIAVVRDITASKETERVLQENEAKFRSIYETSNNAILLLSEEGIFDCNTRTLEIFQLTDKNDINVHPAELSPPQQPDGQDSFSAANNHITRALDTGSARFDWMHRRRNGEDFPAEVLFSAFYFRGRKVLQATVRDVTQKRKSDELIWNQANFDSLTGLPNRRMFYDRLGQETTKSHRSGLPMALMLLDLDHFKEVNDTLGHNMGDILLIEAAQRIKASVRESDTVARLGGDEFIIILSELEDISNVRRIAQTILGKLAAPFYLGEERSFISASIGITFYPGDAADADTLLKNADQAMYAAKAQGRNMYHHFTSSMQAASEAKLRMVNDLRDALSDGQFEIAYEPIVTLASGAIHKAEALIRWQHPTRGLIYPNEFIPVAEETGMIVGIGDWVFREAAVLAAHWRKSHYEQFQVSINISPVQFRPDGANLGAWFDYLRELGLPGRAIVVEITEGLLLDAHISVTNQLQSFRDQGIRVSLDDFGTGYSSLSYLKKFDIDYLKIDRSFVSALTCDSDDMALCDAIIVMAHKLGLEVVAEGIETEEQCALLTAAGCDFGQGYFFSRALRPDDFTSLLAANLAQPRQHRRTEMNPIGGIGLTSARLRDLRRQ